MTSTPTSTSTTSTSSRNHDTNLIINYLPPNYRESELFDLFSHCGPINKVKVICRKDTDESMTYGFVKFQHARDAENAVKELNGREVNGKKIKVSYARRGLDASNSKIFVKRLPPLYTFGDVHSLFSQFGEIIETRLLMDSEGNSRQIAFIQYASRQEADAAIANMSDIIPPGGLHPLIVRFAVQPKTHETHPTDENSTDMTDHSHHHSHQPHHPSSAPIKRAHSHPSATVVNSSPIPTSQSHAPSILRGPGPTHHPTSNFQTQSYHQVGLNHSTSLPQPPPMEGPKSAQYMMYVTFDNVPPHFDIMSFIFLANYGQVIEGKAETQDFQIFHDGVPYLYRTYTGVYSFTLIVEKDRDISNLMGLNMAMVAIQGHYLQVKVSLPMPSFIQFNPLDSPGPFG